MSQHFFSDAAMLGFVSPGTLARDGRAINGRLVGAMITRVPEIPRDFRSPVVEVDRTAFRISKGGLVLSQHELVGATLTIKDANGVRQVVRIDKTMPDPGDAAGEIQLYQLSTQDKQTGEWRNMCQPGPDGLAMGFPIQGTWTSDGRHVDGGSFVLTCTAGAIGKCVRFGYKPWKSGPNGEPLWDYHQACTRMVRADYCGDGTSWTRDGTPIDLYDRLGIQVPDRSQKMQFEAAWGSDGAVCINHPRTSEGITLDDVLKRCSGRLRLACRVHRCCNRAPRRRAHQQ